MQEVGFLVENRERYDTDKTELYLENYECIFAPLAKKPITLLELGIYKGGSLRMWRDFFRKGLIVGLDFNSIKIEDGSGRIVAYQGLQQDTDLLDRIRAETAPDGFDIVIDDASHVGRMTRTSFWHLFDRHLKRGGIYAIEDWGTGYWPDFPDGVAYEEPGPEDLSSHSHGLVGFVKQLVDEQAMGDITNPRGGTALRRRASKFEKLQISHGQVFIWKTTDYEAICSPEDLRVQERSPE